MLIASLAALAALQYEDLEAMLGVGFMLFVLAFLFVPFVVIPIMLWLVRARVKRVEEAVDRIEALLRAEAAKGPRPNDTINPRPNP